MPFLSLNPVNFRNLKNETIDLLAREVYFTGENGQGKSNLLEALYYSAYGASFRTRADSEIIRNSESACALHTLYREENGSTHTTSIKIIRNANKIEKKIEKDGKILHDRKELINTMPCVLYNHDDLDFAVGSPERRRFFIDQSLSMYDVLYIDVMRRYKRVLKNRNLSLKNKAFDLIDTYDAQLVQNGIEIQKKRNDAVFSFNQIFGRLYEEVTEIDGVSIRYCPSWKKNAEVLPSPSEVYDIVHSHREAERVMGTTLTGPHRDRIVFVRKGSAFVPTASTGQRRLLALILRTAQAVFYTHATSKKPVLLMDDVLLELDPEKRRRVTALLPDYDQLFCTFLPGEPYEHYKTDATRVYSIEKGNWKQI